MRQVAVWTLILALIAAGAAIGFSAGQSKRTVHLRTVVGRDAHDTVDKLRQLIDDNTR
jgi:hypothetical protein